ncbi:MAG TPA: DHH family phosphoesterase, partial [Thermoplasmatales archaeon]|nr:DHH family phosphoesterase [Thermoplasmatales archaeon]
MSTALHKCRERVAREVLSQSDVHVVTHIDADGIAAGAIARRCLDRAGIENSIQFVKQLDAETIQSLKDSGRFVWFTDLGSGMISRMAGLECVVTDHHLPEPGRQGSKNNGWHLNPHLFGLDGGQEISGAGLAYTVATAMDTRNRDLVGLAVVGASGDLQDAATCRFEGWNRQMVSAGAELGKVSVQRDIRLFGRQTKPAYKLLQYADDPLLPELSGRERACISFLSDLGIEVRQGEDWRRWIDLTAGEKSAILSRLCRLLITKGFGHRCAARLVGEVYELASEERGTPLRDAREFATLLNSTARYGHADVGLHICLGDRDEYLRRAQSLLQSHRKSIVHGIRFVKSEGIQEFGALQYFNAGAHIRDTVVGIIAGIMLHSRQANPGVPIIGFAEKENGDVKASA